MNPTAAMIPTAFSPDTTFVLSFNDTEQPALSPEARPTPLRLELKRNEDYEPRGIPDSALND